MLYPSELQPRFATLYYDLPTRFKTLGWAVAVNQVRREAAED